MSNPVINNQSGTTRGNLSGAGEPIEPETARLMGRARVMMMISALTTALAIAAVVTVIGYRMFAGASSVPGIDGIITLPKGAHVISTAASAGRLVVLIDVGGASELRSFDIKTLKPAGRLRFATEP